MRNTISVLSLLAIAIGSLYENNYLISPNEIIWSDSVHLSWTDFAGFELPGKELELQIQLTESQRIIFTAVTVTDIVCEKKGGSYSVRSVFYRGKSFYKILSDNFMPTDESLRHELYHFHLTELNARYMRRDLYAKGKSVAEPDMDLLLQKYDDKADSASKAYDKFTRHGISVANQKTLEKTIDSLLLLTGNLK